MLDAINLYLFQIFFVGILLCCFIDEVNDAYLNGTIFKNASLNYADLSGARLKNLSFEGAFLLGARFQYAYLINVDFKGASLSQVDLRNACLVEVSGINWSEEISQDQLSATIIEKRLFRWNRSKLAPPASLDAYKSLSQIESAKAEKSLIKRGL